MNIEAIDYARLHQRKLAIFQPKRTTDLRPELAPMVGLTFCFECTDYGLEDDPFPGQYRWFAVTDEGAIHQDFPWWVPDEDLIDC